MAGPFLDRDRELFVQLESVWGTSPGALAGSDAFKHLTGTKLDKTFEQYKRNRDRDNNQASVLTTHKGREHGTWSIPCDLIPSNNGGTPTPPDVDPFLEAHLGTKHTATAHTTLAAGSTTTIINFTPGGGAASGVAVGDIIVVDVSAAFGLEARQVTNVSTDAITLDRALSAAPAAARNVYLGTTYRLSSTLMKSLYLWQFLNGNNFRHAMPGSIVQNVGIDVDFSQGAPVAGITFDGIGQQKITHATSRPTPVTAGIPLVPTEGKVWLGANLNRIIKYSLKSNNGLDLRRHDSTSLYPTGVKRTGNDSRFQMSQSMDMFLTTGTIEGYHDNAQSLTAYDVIVQLGVTPGQIVAIRTPKWVPNFPEDVVDGEVTLAGEGDLYGVSGDDEMSIAFV